MGFLSRIRPSSGIATTAPAPRGGGGGQGPGGVGDAGILRPGRREGDLTKPGYYPHFVRLLVFHLVKIFEDTVT